MKRTILLFILTAFIAGGLLGYSDLFPLPKETQNTPETKNDVRADSRASGLKLVRNDSSGSRSLPTENTLNSFLLKYTEFSPQETRAELERLLKVQKDDKKYDYALYQSLSYLSFKLAYQSPEEAKRLLDDKSNPQRNILYSSLLEGWAEKDFQGAMGYLLANKTESRESLEAFNSLTANLVTKDVDKALKWLPTLTPGEREAAINTMAGSIPKLHPEKTAEFLAGLTPEELSSYAISDRLASNWANSDWDAFKAWTDTLKMDKQDRILSGGLAGLCRTDLPKATEELKKMDKKNRDSIGRSMIYNMDYEENSRGKALDWVLENRDTFSDVPYLVKTAASTWYSDSPEAEEKVLQIPEGEIRDSALSGLIEGQSSRIWSDDYAENRNDKFTNLLALAEKIGDSQKRDSATQECVERWTYTDPENAKKWIEQKSQLSAKIKQNLLEQCDQRQKEKKTSQD